MSNEFGYIPESPEQSNLGGNKGIFTPTDIYDLTRDSKWTSAIGQLELIQTQSVSSVSTVNFTSIQETEYNTHFFTMNNLICSDDAGISGKFSNDGGSTYEAANYQYALAFGAGNNSFGFSRSTSSSTLTRFGALGTLDREVGNGYAYFYGLGNANRYNIVTQHSSSINSNGANIFYWGAQAYKVAETINAFQIFPTAGTFSGKFSLYGIKEGGR